MKYFFILTLLLLHLCCTNINSRSYIANASEEVSKIDREISETDTYKYMGHLRYPSYHFNKTDFPLFDSNFIQSLVTAYYDTLTRRITRIQVYSYKCTTSGPAQIDDFYFDNNNQLMKINIVDVTTDPQNFASYYFQGNMLIFEGKRNVEIKNLHTYLLKVNSIYKKVSKTLIDKKLIDNP